MDSGRKHDLEVLNRVLNDPAESDLHKRQARLAISKIQRVARDPVIASARERLIKAHRANDTVEAEKIGSYIREYQGRKYGYV